MTRLGAYQKNKNKCNQINDRLSLWCISVVFPFITLKKKKGDHLLSTGNAFNCLQIELRARDCVRRSSKKWKLRPDVESICSSDIYSRHSAAAQSVGNLFGCELMMPKNRIFTMSNREGGGIEWQSSKAAQLVYSRRRFPFCVFVLFIHQKMRWKDMKWWYDIRFGEDNSASLFSFERDGWVATKLPFFFPLPSLRQYRTAAKSLDDDSIINPTFLIIHPFTPPSDDRTKKGELPDFKKQMEWGWFYFINSQNLIRTTHTTVNKSESQEQKAAMTAWVNAETTQPFPKTRWLEQITMLLQWQQEKRRLLFKHQRN